MKGYLLTIIILGMLPICFIRPWIGILVWSWIGYMNPHRLVWGFAYSMPFAQMVVVATIAGLFFTKEKRPFPLTKEVCLLFALWGIFLLSTLFAINPDFAWYKLFELSKILLLTFIMLSLFQEPKKLRAFIWVITLSIGYYGLKGGIWAILTGGQYSVLGPPNSFIEGNTNLGVAMLMVLPFFLYLRQDVSRPWLRHLLLSIFCFTFIAILFTYSRGALIGLIAVVFLMILKSRKKMLILPLLVVILVFASPFLPEKWIGRMSTIEKYEEDASAMSRLRAWEVAYSLALDRPILGGGFGSITKETYYQYMPDDFKEFTNIGTGAHSIYLHMLSEHGFTGLILYLILILSTMISLRQIMRKTRNNLSMRWIFNCAHMLETSFIGFLVSGVFLSMTYFDLFFGMLAITIILKKLVLIQDQKETKTTDYGQTVLSQQQVSYGSGVTTKRQS